jgi:hypothetical protein
MFGHQSRGQKKDFERQVLTPKDSFLRIIRVQNKMEIAINGDKI